MKRPMTKSMFAIATSMLGFAFVAIDAREACAQTYPVRPIRFLMPHPAGAGMDFVSRTIAQKLTERWHQQVIVDSRPGGGGIIGLQMAANAQPDGYTLIPSSI